MLEALPRTPAEWAALWWTLPVLLVVAGLVGGVLWWRATAVRREMERALAAAAIAQLRELVIPDGVDGQTYLECLLLTPRGLLVLDLRDVRGAVFGAEKMDEWTVLDGVKRFTFRNPLFALHDRVAALRHHVGDAVPVDGRILFSSRGRFPKGKPPLSLTLAELAAEVERLGGPRGAGVEDPVQRAWDELARSQQPQR
jgi:hypothetical protein